MSLTLNMVGGGGGGFSTKNAMIHVKAPLGSTITFSKGGVVVKSLGPDKAYTNADGENADYYLSVSANNYGEWTITGTLSDQSGSKIVTVDTAKQYDMELYFWSGEIYMHGEQYPSYTGGLEVVHVSTYTSAPIAQVSYGSAPNGVISLSVTGTNSNGAVCTVNPINLTQFSTVTAKFENSFHGENRLFVMANSSKSGITLDSNSNRHCDFWVDAGQGGNVTLDVSSANGSFYLLIGGFTVSPTYSCTISEWYLS